LINSLYLQDQVLLIGSLPVLQRKGINVSVGFSGLNSPDL